MFDFDSLPFCDKEQEIKLTRIQSQTNVKLEMEKLFKLQTKLEELPLPLEPINSDIPVIDLIQKDEIKEVKNPLILCEISREIYQKHSFSFSQSRYTFPIARLVHDALDDVTLYSYFRSLSLVV